MLHAQVNETNSTADELLASINGNTKNDLLDNFKKTNEVSFEFSNKSILIQ